MAEMDEFDFMGRCSNDVNGVDVRAAIDGVMACLWFMLIVCRLAIVLGFPSGGLRFESWGDASGFTPVVRGFLRIGGLLFGVTKVVVTAGGAIAVLTDPPSTNLTPPVPKKKKKKSLMIKTVNIFNNFMVSVNHFFRPTEDLYITTSKC
ncbi:hypothetical protein LXL04_006497 [Taraxacum kok-saghyz]